ncbi:hypothetical protein KY308_01775 [Candidatus Woesearchaeota archaeon]|nr:hypothetical protein [Candidatus Woesearchaeota archaeon]
MMMKCDDMAKWKMCKGICMIILGVLIWLNAAYAWLSWSKFIALIAVLWGLKMLLCSGCCKGKKK